MGNDSYQRGYRSDPPGRSVGSDSGPSTDPLTELARLIGQGDPLGSDNSRAQRRPEPQTQPSDWHAEPARGAQPYEEDAHDDRYGEDRDRDRLDHDRYDDGHRPGGYPPNPRAHASEPRDDRRYDDDGYQDESYYDDPHDAAEATDHDGQQAQQEEYGAQYYGDGEDEYYDEAPAPRRRGWLVTAAALVGLALVGTAGAFAYRAVFTGGPPAIIARDPAPNKIMPSQNAETASSKQLDRLSTRSPDERFVTREEQPVALPEPTRNAPAPLVGQGVASAYPSAPSNITPPPTIPADTPLPAAPGNGAGPRKIRTLAVNSDMSPVDTASTRPSPRLPSQQGAAARASAQRAPLSLSPQEDAGPPSQIAAAPPPVPAPPVAAPPAAPPMRTSSLAPAATPPAAPAGSAATGDYFVQITAQRSEEEAQSSFQSFQAKYASLLGGHQPVIRRKDLGSKGIFFGAQIGPFSHEDAVSMCQSLKSAGAPCMLQKN